MIAYIGKAANGATVMIDTSMCAAKGSEEEQRIIEDQRRAAHQILVGMAQTANE